MTTFRGLVVVVAIRQLLSDRLNSTDCHEGVVPKRFIESWSPTLRRRGVGDRTRNRYTPNLDNGKNPSAATGTMDSTVMKSVVGAIGVSLPQPVNSNRPTTKHNVLVSTKTADYCGSILARS